MFPISRSLGPALVSQVVNTQLFDLATDPREQVDLLKDGTGGCCSMLGPHEGHDGPNYPHLRRSRLSTSCRAAAEIFYGENVSWQKGSSLTGVPLRAACCHLQNAAVEFAGSNLRFYGRQSHSVTS